MKNKLVILLAIMLILLAMNNYRLMKSNNKLLNENLSIKKARENSDITLKNYKNESEKLIAKTNDELKDKEQISVSLKKKINQLNNDIKILEKYRVLDEYSLNSLGRAGIEDFTIIEKDLMMHSDIIQISKGTPWEMSFVKVHLINDNWCFGLFENGHNSGFGIYEYVIDKNGDILWELIIEKLKTTDYRGVKTEKTN